MIKDNKSFIIDMDSTITNCTEHWIDILNNRYNINLSWKDVNSFHDGIEKLLIKSLGISEEEANKIAQEPLYEKGFFFDQKPYENAIEVINELIDKYNDKIIIGTKPPFSSLYAFTEKFYWIKKHFEKNFDKIKFVGTGDKECIRGDYLIDDAIHNLKKSKGVHKLIRYYQEWNKEFKDADYTVYKWDDVLKIREQIREQI